MITSTCSMFAISPKRELVAWARGSSSLSDNSLAWARLTELVKYLYVFNDWLVYRTKKFKYVALYVLYDIMGLELLRVVWINSWIMVGWLDIGMRLLCLINLSLVGETCVVWDWRNSMKHLVVKFHGGVGCDGRNSMNLLVRFHGGVVVYIMVLDVWRLTLCVVGWNWGLGIIPIPLEPRIWDPLQLACPQLLQQEEEGEWWWDIPHK